MIPESIAPFIEPFHFMGIALSYLPSTLLSLLLALDFRTLFSWSRLRAAWFGRFWARVGPDVRTNAEAKVIPLLQGRVTHGRVPPPPSAEDTTTTSSFQEQGGEGTPHPPVSGTVLEIGPGSGMWTSIFSPKYLPSITKVYGVEPNPAQHPALQRQIAAAGLDDGTYEIVPVGIEDLAASGRVPLNSVDCIVTIMCLCSIPEPEHNIRQLYGYLKPGGRWYAYEHVKCFREQGVGMRLYQGE
jgi:SAM-dependent methyltransferase